MKYRVEFTETVTYSCVVEIEAESEEAAEKLVKSMDASDYETRDEVDANLEHFDFEELE